MGRIIDIRSEAYTRNQQYEKEKSVKLSELKKGTTARIETVEGTGELRQHILDMGVIPGAEITFIKYAPMGDPMQFRVHDYLLTLRAEDAKKIGVTPLEKGSASREDDFEKETEHPGLGEGGRFHNRATENPLPEGTTLTFALVGNQNTGKTTLFNRLTGANQHVGNFPGVTVDRKDGVIRGHKNTIITDLPGIYSMSPYSGEEIVSRNFVLNERPHAIINIVDATNMARNLYLTMQLLEMDVPVVVALNMMDEVTGNGGSVDVNAMEKMLGTPVVPISAAKNQGIEELVEHAIHIAKYREAPVPRDIFEDGPKGAAMRKCINAVSDLIEPRVLESGTNDVAPVSAEKKKTGCPSGCCGCSGATEGSSLYDEYDTVCLTKPHFPLRFAAAKIIEGDELILKQMKLSEDELGALELIIKQMENERGLDRNAAMADMRFSYIDRVCRRCVRKPSESKEHKRSLKIDRILTGKFTALPVFIGIMALIFYLTFNVIGAWLQDLVAAGFEALAESVECAMVSAGVNEVVRGLVIEGVIEGVGSVVSFLPIIVIMFFFLSVLEDSGYIARVAFFMDKLLRRIGLSGRSIVPLLIGFGCTVPAVMSTRTLPSERDRKMTILLTPFMSCTAKLPIYGFFVSAFFPGRGALVMTGIYVLGIVVGILVALLFKKTLFKGEAVPFVMELPNYRLPGVRNTLHLLWDKSKDFLKKAFTVILVATIAVWFLKSFDFRFNLVEDSADSMLAMISGAIAPVFIPTGLGDWRIVTSLISGFMAKESVVSVLEVLFGPAENVAAVISASVAIPLLVFSLLYTPCVAAVASVRRELGVKWALGLVAWQCGIAWVGAWVAHLICG